MGWALESKECSDVLLGSCLGGHLRRLFLPFREATPSGRTRAKVSVCVKLGELHVWPLDARLFFPCGPENGRHIFLSLVEISLRAGAPRDDCCEVVRGESQVDG